MLGAGGCRWGDDAGGAGFDEVAAAGFDWEVVEGEATDVSVPAGAVPAVNFDGADALVDDLLA